MKRPPGWTLAWLAWLGFVLLDIVAAARERIGAGRVLTLSRHVWAWFHGPRRGVLAAFLAALFAHLVFEASAWWLLTAVPFVAVIVDGVWWGGELSLIDKAARALAGRWLKGKVDGARKGGSSVFKFLDGQKRLVVVLAFIVSGFVALLTGNDVSQWIDLGLRAFGWSDPELIAAAQDTATQIVPMLFAIWAAGHALWKMWKQSKAGATASELGSPVGVVKAAIADGTLKSSVPVTLSIADKPQPAPSAVPVVEVKVKPAAPLAVVKREEKAEKLGS